MAELADAHDSGSCVLLGLAGSTPVPGTKKKIYYQVISSFFKIIITFNFYSLTSSYAETVL